VGGRVSDSLFGTLQMKIAADLNRQLK